MEPHPMLMPDPARIKEVAPEYVPLDTTIQWYTTLPGKFRGYFNSCGKGSTDDPPTMEPPKQVTDSGLANFKNYAVTAASLQQAAGEINDSAKVIVPLAQKTAAISKAAQQAVNDGIDMINAAAPTVPKPGVKEDQHIYEYCNDAIQAVATAFDKASSANADTAGDAGKETAKLKELEEQIKKLQQENADLKKKLLDPADVPQVPTTPTTPGTDPPPVTPVDDGSVVPGLDDLNPTTPGVDTGTTPTGNSLDDKVQQALDDLNNSAAANPSTATPASVPDAAAASPANSGMDMMSSMLPMMMAQMMNRGQADTDLNSRRGEYDPYEDQLRAVPAAVAPAQPAVQQPVTSTPAPATNTAPPANSSSTQPTTGMPGRTPNSDGTVVYTFPDGRTQKVSATVAQALDAAFGNASGTDAQAAYAKTPAKWSDKKQIGTAVDPYQLMTGDVAVWDARTAIVVAFPADDGGTLEVVVNGQLKQFTPTEMSDSAGEFGQFVGFSHPNGIDATAPEDHDQGKMSGMPVTGDPSAGAAMPAVAAPA
ncbi:bZIP transcription factor [Nocardia sp. CA-084685]|uniref:bZIP transcription factor n=1 Tax=Nocardia sp. CA-084685 TaxID=3239970 RepID=UPI003D954DA2